MDLLTNIYFTAFILGVIHAIEVDHVVAVSVFAGLKPKIANAAQYGFKWGIGHAFAVVAVGCLIAGLGIKIPEDFSHWGEIIVGVALIALGFWALKTGQRFHAHTPQQHANAENNENNQSSDIEHSHGHLHAHDHSQNEPHDQLHRHTHDEGHDHRHDDRHDEKNNEKKFSHHQHLPAALGALHGLAGSAPVLALIPITLIDSFYQAVFYLLSFSLGATLSMMLYAVLAAIAIQRIDQQGKSALLNVKMITRVIAVITIAVGVWWLMRAL